jgi:hypothetical protein
MWVAVRAGDLYSPVTPERVIFCVSISTNQQKEQRCGIGVWKVKTKAKEETYIANSVVVNIDPILEQALCATLSWNSDRAVADLSRVGFYDEGFVKGEDTVDFAPFVVLVFTPLLVVVVFVPGRDSDSSGGQEGDDSCGEVHFDVLSWCGVGVA